jgi:hypothetical protein
MGKTNKRRKARMTNFIVFLLGLFLGGIFLK